ncbi:MAG: hypothetical protein M3Q14_04200 [bacterium]|nr:hypothetical protein [bacterium]
MSEAEKFGMDDDVFNELQEIGEKITTPPLYPAVERNFGDDSDREFKEATEVVQPIDSKLLPSETLAEAHVRLQKESGNE